MWVCFTLYVDIGFVTTKQRQKSQNTTWLINTHTHLTKTTKAHISQSNVWPASSSRLKKVRYKKNSKWFPFSDNLIPNKDLRMVNTADFTNMWSKEAATCFSITTGSKNQKKKQTKRERKKQMFLPLVHNLPFQQFHAFVLYYYVCCISTMFRKLDIWGNKLMTSLFKVSWSTDQTKMAYVFKILGFNDKNEMTNLFQILEPTNKS